MTENIRELTAEIIRGIMAASNNLLAKPNSLLIHDSNTADLHMTADESYDLQTILSRIQKAPGILRIEGRFYRSHPNALVERAGYLYEKGDSIHHILRTTETLDGVDGLTMQDFIESAETASAIFPQNAPQLAYWSVGKRLHGAITALSKLDSEEL